MALRISRLVEEQVRNWNHQSSLHLSGRNKKIEKKQYPVLTVSREFGARGAAVAQLLGRKTGFKVWDKELLQAIADELGSDKKMVETLDERRQQAVEDVVASFIKNVYTNVDYLSSLVRVVSTIEEYGNAIIVGRGANYICQNPMSFHLRVVNPFSSRVIEYAKRENLRQDEARQIIREKDAERAEFIKRNFNRDVNNASDYDLIINSGSFELEQIADTILETYEKRIGRKVEFSM